MSTSNFKTLESKVDELIKLCGDMKKENQLLLFSEELRNSIKLLEMDSSLSSKNGMDFFVSPKRQKFLWCL